MNWPQQVQGIPNNRKMEAPYNFVPLPEKVLVPYENDDEIPRHDNYDPELHTGFIDLKITVETLLYTRCAYQPNLAERPVTQLEEKQQFFHYKDRNIPVIPGSSIRGMIRSLVEILGFGKIGSEQIAEDYLVYRAIADSSSLGASYRTSFMGDGQVLEYPLKNVRGGYLRKRNHRWYIQPAVEYHGESFVHTKRYPSFAQARPNARAAYSGQDIKKVWLIPPHRSQDFREGRPPLNIAQVDVSNIVEQSGAYQNTSPSGSHVHGTLVRSGHMNNKHRHCVIYKGDSDTSKWILISDEMWQRYTSDRDINRGIPNRKLEQDGDPLFYLVNDNDDLLFFGPTKMFRIPYPYSTVNFIPQEIKSFEKIDLTEAIFGSTKRKGRVRFSDATYIGNLSNPFIENNRQGRIVPKILSSPKPTSFQNYLVQTTHNRNNLKNYNHPFEERNRQTQDNENIRNNERGTIIRGHKLYWNKRARLEDIEEQDGWNKIQIPKPQNTVIKPVKPNTIFTSRIYLENLSNLELGVLISSLQLKDENSRHRLGMGKPYGMGRVKIEWDLNLENRMKRYENLFKSNDECRQNCEEEIHRAVHLYKEKIISHTNFSSSETIWEIPRLQSLGLLLDRNGPPSGETEYVGINNQGVQRWRQRQVLPSPQQVMGLNINTNSRNVQPAPTGHRIQRDIANNDIVTCVVLDEKSKRNKQKFQIKDGEGKGVLHPQSMIPPNLTPGQELKLRVKSNDPKNMQFEWTDGLC